jgi:hypothetical protein
VRKIEKWQIFIENFENEKENQFKKEVNKIEQCGNIYTLVSP